MGHCPTQRGRTGMWSRCWFLNDATILDGVQYRWLSSSLSHGVWTWRNRLLGWFSCHDARLLRPYGPTVRHVRLCSWNQIKLVFDRESISHGPKSLKIVGDLLATFVQVLHRKHQLLHQKHKVLHGKHQVLHGKHQVLHEKYQVLHDKYQVLHEKHQVLHGNYQVLCSKYYFIQWIICLNTHGLALKAF